MKNLSIKDILPELKIKLTLTCEEQKHIEDRILDMFHTNDKKDEEDALFSKFEFIQEKNAILAQVNLKVQHESSYIHSVFEKVEILCNAHNSGNYLSLFNYNGWWTKPEFAKTVSEIPQNTQVLSWQDNGMSFVLMTLCDDQFKSIIQGSDTTFNIALQSNTSGYSEINTKVFVLCYDENPYKAFSNAVAYALEKLDSTKKTAAKRRYPDMFNYLGFCTWNAFYHDVNLSGTLKKADEFVSKNLPVKWFLIDHGWSLQEAESVSSFREDTEKFPGGLLKLKEELQKRHIPYLGVWQGFGGHWGTIAKNSEIHKEMKENLLETHTGHLIPYPSREKSFAFWNKWHRYLAQNGVDFVKVDIQSSLRVFTKGMMPIGVAAKESHLGLEASVGVNFDGALINCMGMAMEQVVNRPVSALSRNSNDFFPHKPNSFTKHVYENAYNTLYHGEFFHGDFDMWWTTHPEAINNSYLRALSGGPLYISDKVDETDAAKLIPHILHDGFVLRCDKQGVIAKDQIYYDPATVGEALKVCNRKGKTGYVGAFNSSIEDKPVRAYISVQDIEGIANASKYAVYEYEQKSFSIVDSEQVLESKIEHGKSKFYSITPIEKGITCLGSVDKLISSAVIDKEKSAEDSYFCVLKQGGVIAFYCEGTPNVLVNGKEIELIQENGVYTFNCSNEKETTFVHITIK